MSEQLNISEPVIIIPAYCPDARLVKLIIEIHKLKNLPIVVIDDGSGGKYRKIFLAVEEIPNCIVYYHEKNQGKGTALKNGVRLAAQKYPENLGYVTADADGQHSAKDIVKIANSITENAEGILIGTRDFSSDNVPFRSKIGNAISSLMFYFVTWIRCKDTQTGLRGITRNNEEEFLYSEGTRYEFEMNFLINVAKKHIGIKEVPIDTIYLEENKSSHYNTIKDSFRIFTGIFKFAGSSIVSALIDLTVFTILTSGILYTSSLGIIDATIMARICSGIINFLLNQRWVFNGSKNTSEAIKYVMLFIFQMGASGFIVSRLSSKFVNLTVTKIVVDSILFFLSYFIQKHFIFKKRNKERIKVGVSKKAI